MTPRFGCISTALLSAVFGLSAAVVSVPGDGTLLYYERTPWSGEITIDFAPCMANELFTFSSVTLDSVVVNRTSSDNIGPFGLAGGGWSGGNHLNGGKRSARTDSVVVSLDGRPVALSAPLRTEGSVLTVTVSNTLLMPADTVPFALETMTYRVAGNSIEVTGEHRIVAPRPVAVDRYYGMQSMFDGETEILTPGGAYGVWTPVAAVDRFDRCSAPGFTTFIEHSPHAYQACWMDSAIGIGDRHLVADDDWVFIGNSWTKAYHKLIGGKMLAPGDTTRWHGVYTWFKEPVADGCRGPEPGHYAFVGNIGGKSSLFYIDKYGKTSIITIQ